MSDDEGERRRKYEEYSDRVAKHRAREDEHAKHAIKFASGAMRAITYLNGGALVAIPAAVALFKADPEKAKYDLVFAGVLFVAGLLSIVIAQASAFFLFARREEAERSLTQQQIVILTTLHYPGTSEMQAQRASEAAAYEQHSNERKIRSGQWRKAALVLFWLALGFFVVGCYFGAQAILKG
jgi:hypothetical protein